MVRGIEVADSFINSICYIFLMGNAKSFGRNVQSYSCLITNKRSFCTSNTIR